MKNHTHWQKSQYPIGKNANTPIGENAKENITRRDYYEGNICDASAPPPEEAPEPTPEKSKRPALLDRKPKNDMERVEKLYLENYEDLKKQEIVKTDLPINGWGQ